MTGAERPPDMFDREFEWRELMVVSVAEWDELQETIAVLTCHEHRLGQEAGSGSGQDAEALGVVERGDLQTAWPLAGV